MIEIYIDKKRAVLQKDTSFDFVCENRLFSGSDSYTLNITFPLRGCHGNIEIFGHINRKDVLIGKVRFDCEIRDCNFNKFGTITITEISEIEVKTQFLEGRSEQNFDDTFDKIYINELDLGSPPTTDLKEITPSQAWNPNFKNPQFVALPWNNDYSGNIQNLAECIVDDEVQAKYHYEWNESLCTGLSWQPYLIYISKKICEAIGYSFDFSKWEASEEYRYLLICNTLPFAWDMPEFAHALPKWTVEEFFQKLELFLEAEFNFDHRRKFVSFDFTKDILEGRKPVRIDNIINEHSTQVTADESKCEYQENRNISYKKCDHEMWKFYSCPWFIEGWKNNIVRYNSMNELFEANKHLKSWLGYHKNIKYNGDIKDYTNVDKILYAADCDAYFIIRPVSRSMVFIGSMYAFSSYRCVLQQINMFGGRIVDSSPDAKTEEIEFVPAWIDSTEDKYGNVLFLPFGNYDEDFSESIEEDEHPFMKTYSLATLEAGEPKEKTEYYDRIYIGFWDGSQNTRRKLPHPEVMDIEIPDDWSSFSFRHFSLRINNKKAKRNITIHQVENKIKYVFKFISDTIPDVRSVFHIKGKRYICEKITATFTEKGMSQLLKGEFYPIAD